MAHRTTPERGHTRPGRRALFGSIRARLLASLVAVAVLVAAGLSFYFLQELQAYGQRKLEERLSSESFLTAKLAANLDLQDPVAAGELLAGSAEAVYSDVAVIDFAGTVVAASGADVEVGDDLSGSPEVQRALDGTPNIREVTIGGGRLEMLAAHPVIRDGIVVGVARSSARMFSPETLLRDYRDRIIVAAVVFVLLLIVVAEVLSRSLARPFSELEAAVAGFAAGDHSVRARPTGSRETRAVAESFNALADEVSNALTELRAEERRKSRFVSDVSHELRTPLTAIRGTAETLLDSDVDEADRARFLATIVRESDRLARLADDLLTLQRIEGVTGELPLRRVELLDVVARAVESLEHLTEQRNVTVRVEGDAADVLGDPDRLQQIFANLVDNASRHMSGEGNIRITLEDDQGYSRISVLDEGPGIPEEDIPHLFDRFYRAQPSRDRSTGGAGLGLSIVKAIVDRHAGDITVTNRPEGGSAFIVRLPSIAPGR